MFTSGGRLFNKLITKPTGSSLLAGMNYTPIREMSKLSLLDLLGPEKPKPRSPMANFKGIFGDKKPNPVPTEFSGIGLTAPSLSLLYDGLIDRNKPYKERKYSGRSVTVNNNDGLRAFYRLNGILKKNNVRAELKQHRYYEKPCLKRVRLRQELNRDMFKAEVSRKVAIVLKLKNRGA